jgi:hypothetical protein
MRTRLLAVAACAAACSPPPPPPAVIAVGATADTIVVPVVSITAAVPRPDGNWVLVAPTDNQVWVADFGTHTARQFPGIAPAELPHPLSLIGLGDTTVISDWGLHRFSTWSPTGQRLMCWPAPVPLQLALPRARDAAGQWYFQVAPEPGADGAGLVDSGAVVRADPLLTHFDTLARLAPPDLVRVAGMNGDRYQRRTFGGDDAWGVRPDGTLWLARVFQNRVEWYQPGSHKPERSPLLPDPVLTVSDMDRELYVRRFPPEQQDEARGLPNSPVKPPFEHVYAAPDGHLWLAKSDTALSPLRHLQVVDRKGVVVVVTVPSRGSMLGTDGTSILMAEEFPGGIRLLRYPVPREALVVRQ